MISFRLTTWPKDCANNCISDSVHTICIVLHRLQCVQLFWGLRGFIVWDKEAASGLRRRIAVRINAQPPRLAPASPRLTELGNNWQKTIFHRTPIKASTLKRNWNIYNQAKNILGWLKSWLFFIQHSWGLYHIHKGSQVFWSPWCFGSQSQILLFLNGFSPFTMKLRFFETLSDVLNVRCQGLKGSSAKIFNFASNLFSSHYLLYIRIF